MSRYARQQHVETARITSLRGLQTGGRFAASGLPSIKPGRCWGIVLSASTSKPLIFQSSLSTGTNTSARDTPTTMIWTRFLSITLFALATARAQAQQCPPGNELRGDECQPCYPGGFSAGGSDPCQVCPGGSVSADFGASSCTQCPANTYANYDGASCSDCPEYTTSAPGTADPQQCQATNCPPGAVGVGSQCYGCDAGTYASGGYPGSCQLCQPGQQANE